MYYGFLEFILWPIELLVEWMAWKSLPEGGTLCSDAEPVPCSWHDSLKQLAEVTGGRLLAGSKATGPVLIFKKDGHSAKLHRVLRRGRASMAAERITRLGIIMARPSPVTASIVARELEGLQEKKQRGLRTVTTGTGWFDDAFHVRLGEGDPAETITAESLLVLVRGVQRISGKGQVEIRVRRGRRGLAIEKHAWFEQFLDVLAMARLGISIANQLAQDGKVVVHGSICPVCGFPVEGRKETCPDCDAQLHVECWELNDGCTCGG